jgi:signal transduction histidine kinase
VSDDARDNTPAGPGPDGPDAEPPHPAHLPEDEPVSATGRQYGPNGSAATEGDYAQQVQDLVAELERVEAQFNQVREHLTHTHRLATLGTLSSIVAHEYNNLLTPVVNYARMALAEDDPKLMRKALNKCLEGAERATRISHSLLGFARQDETPGEARLPSTVDEAVRCLGRDPVKDGIELVTDVADLTVAMSPLNLQQVLVNLMLNAKKAMRRTGGRLEVRTPEPDPTEPVTLEVADTGPGIPDGIREGLFEPFVTQSHEPNEPAAEKTGTGLGLSVCRDLVHNAHGQIEVQSTPGEGTIFRLTLPRAAAEAQQPECARS